MHKHKLAVVAKNLVNMLRLRNMVQGNDKVIGSDLARMNVAAGVFILHAHIALNLSYTCFSIISKYRDPSLLG